MIRTFARLAALLVPFALAACASEPRPTHARGWIGGQFADVSRAMRAWEPGLPPIERDGAVIGMPEVVPGDGAALLTSVYDGTPAARAGLAPGDLVTAIDGRPVESALDLRERVESLAPGSHATISSWRDGATRTADVVVGRETYESTGEFGFGLSLSPTLDLWPFDDGIDILHLLRIRWDARRFDVNGPEGRYLRQVHPADEVVGPRQESTDVWLLVAGVSKGRHVLSQETLP